jgi:hypothetical protein
MIDPWEAFIQFLLSRPELAALDRQIGRSYDRAWQSSTPALVVALDNGTPSDYAPVHQIRFETRCFSSNVEETMNTWLALITISRDTNRNPILTSAGTGLVYSMLQASGPSNQYDQDLALHEMSGFWDVTISEVIA